MYVKQCAAQRERIRICIGRIAVKVEIYVVDEGSPCAMRWVGWRYGTFDCSVGKQVRGRRARQQDVFDARLYPNMEGLDKVRHAIVRMITVV